MIKVPFGALIAALCLVPVSASAAFNEQSTAARAEVASLSQQKLDARNTRRNRAAHSTLTDIIGSGPESGAGG